ncbi:MAG: DUF523 and DUF1722 domain-containing protein [Lentisphaerae bacterium]|nr:DUF523 and DUF1722 domain-containing protein [Lentisphaerota bacterium]
MATRIAPAVPAPATPAPIRLGISTCLLGVRVRFDGGHKRDPYITELLGQYFEWVPVCPEVEVGMSTPRESLRLVGTAAAPRLLTVRTKVDWTARMEHYARERAAAIKAENLDGYILKSKSPSCGMERVKVYTEDGMPNHAGVGLYARELMRQCPALPIEEEGRLNDAALRENFIVRVFTHARWRQLRAQRFSAARLVDFQARHKLLLMAHSETHMRQLGRLVATAGHHPAAGVLAAYETGLFEALRTPATRKRHTNALHHAAGYFRDGIPDAARQELADVIDRYRRGLLPLIVPVTLIRHHLLLCPQPYLSNQIYFDPHPQELMLLNHV